MSHKEYARHADAFGAAVHATQDWDAMSPCEGWTARDVLGHVIETQRDFLGRHEVEVGKPVDLVDPAAAWAAHDTAVRTALAEPEVESREFAGYFGPTTVGATMARFYGFDLVVHRWDLAQAMGRDERFSDAELDVLETSIDGFGDQLYAEGICKPGLEVGPDADRQERVLARLGRAVPTLAE